MTNACTACARQLGQPDDPTTTACGDACLRCMAEAGDPEAHETMAHLVAIDRLSHYELCRRWRFAPTGDPLLQGTAGDYFKHRLFTKLGGFTPAISKSIGWNE